MKKRKIFSLLSLAAVTCAFLLGGCYHMGSLAHPGLKTVAVAPVINETAVYNVSNAMRNKLCEQFQLDGSLKLVSLEEADCIVYVTIKDVAISASGDNNYDQGRGIYMPALWELRMTGEFTVSVPGRATALVSKRSVSGNSKYQKNADPQVSQNYGLEQAAWQMAGEIVSLTTEAW